MCLEGLPQFSLDKLVASISPCGLTGKEMLIKGFDRGEKAGTFPHGALSHLPPFPVTMALHLKANQHKASRG